MSWSDEELTQLARDLRLPPLGLVHWHPAEAFWRAVTGRKDPPWYAVTGNVWRLPVVGRGPSDPLTLYLRSTPRAGPAPVFVVFAQAVLEAEGRCPEPLTAAAAVVLSVGAAWMVDAEELADGAPRW